MTYRRKFRQRQPQLRYLGSGGDRKKYTDAYLSQRLWQLRKDMTTCLASRRRDDGKGFVHAYFPALVTCCGILELFANLHSGDSKVQNKRYDRLEAYIRFLPGKSYTRDNLEILYKALRNPIAHHGVAAGLHEETSHQSQFRRITWMLTADTRQPALKLLAKSGTLKNDPLTDRQYSHRMCVRLGRLWRDIYDSVDMPKGYRAAVLSDPTLLRKFHRCIDQIFPR